MMKMKTALSFIAAANLALTGAMFAGGPKTFQVTGTILEVSPTKIALQKDGDRWEIDLDPQTKVNGELKVGAKVKITYTMSATKIDSSALTKLKATAEDAAAAIASSVPPGAQKKEEPAVSPSASPQ
jgi:uncharacterized protein YdgA (DUF945 family)